MASWPRFHGQAEAEEAADLAARLAATEETRRQERIRAAEALALAADTSTGLPTSSLYVPWRPFSGGFPWCSPVSRPF